MHKTTIPFMDLSRSYEEIRDAIDEAVAKVLNKSIFILGEEVALFEKEFSAYVGAQYGIGVASGTDALILALRAAGIGISDEVIMPVNSYPTAFAVAAAGAVPRFVDIDPNTFTLSGAKLEASITPKTKAIIPVHLYGQACDMKPILAIAKKHKLVVIEDAAQAHGAKYNGRHVGTLGDIGCFSFYPTKNLGGFGDGGMVVTNNKKIATTIRQLRMYGEIARYESIRLGVNSRLDEIQAAILRVKLKKLREWNTRRRQIAKLYEKYLAGVDIVLPQEERKESHVYHLYVIRTKRRDELKKYLLDQGIATAIHFPKPLHFVTPFQNLGYAKGAFPYAEQTVKEIVSLPCYPQLTDSAIKTICNSIKYYLR